MLEFGVAEFTLHRLVSPILDLRSPVCQRQFEIVRKSRRNFVIFRRRGGVTESDTSLLEKSVHDLLFLAHKFFTFFELMGPTLDVARGTMVQNPVQDMERISDKRIIVPKAKAAEQSKPNLLIDIQTKMQQINSPGFERWAKIFNFKEMAKTVMYLQENGLTDLGKLEKICDAAVQKFNDLSDRTKAASARMKDISELQRHIGMYSKTREVYAQYRKLTGRKQAKFYEQHTSELRSVNRRSGTLIPSV